MKKIFYLAIAALIPVFSLAQKASNFTFEKGASINLGATEPDMEATINNLEAPSPGGNSYKDYLQELKAGIIKTGSSHSSQAANKKAIKQPRTYRSFDANPYNGIPNDNHLAISNGGKIISVNNSRILVYDENGKELLRRSLKVIADPLNLPGTFYDPRVLYDPDEDRFVLCFLGGRYDSTSNIVFGFSKTNDPAGEWNLYSLPGNPFDDESWSDYPMIAFTKDELFFTINLLRHTQPGETWKDVFKQTVIWQIDKKSGFNGDSELKTKLHSGIEWDNKPIRNVCPVKGGSGNQGPNMYFLSNRNFDLKNDTIFFIEVTGKMNDANTKVEIQVLKSDINYGVAPDASQNIGVLKLQTNDSRVLDAFLENDRILFASNCVNFDNNWASVYLGTITNPSSAPKVKAQIIKSDSLEFGYPGLAYAGNSSTENDAILFVNHTSKDHNPGCGVFYFDGTDLSDYKYVKEGDSYIKITNGENQRWGDYIGCQRKYNEPGEAWVGGTYGWEKSNSQRQYATWIAEVASPTAANVNAPLDQSAAELYPNPAQDRLAIRFKTANSTYASFKILNAKGQLVEHFFNEKVKAGENEFSINVNQLEAGVYIILIQDEVNGTALVKHRFVVE